MLTVNVKFLFGQRATASDSLEALSFVARRKTEGCVSGAPVGAAYWAFNPSADVHSPFGVPRRVAVAGSDIGAPSLSYDGRELFFHEKIDGTFSIYRVNR